jgi:hypothetical protein
MGTMNADRYHVIFLLKAFLLLLYHIIPLLPITWITFCRQTRKAGRLHNWESQRVHLPPLVGGYSSKLSFLCEPLPLHILHYPFCEVKLKELRVPRFKAAIVDGRSTPDTATRRADSIE